MLNLKKKPKNTVNIKNTNKYLKIELHDWKKKEEENLYIKKNRQISKRHKSRHVTVILYVFCCRFDSL